MIGEGQQAGTAVQRCLVFNAEFIKVRRGEIEPHFTLYAHFACYEYS